MMFETKPPTIIEFEKTKTKDLTSEAVQISIQGADPDKCCSLFDHVLKGIGVG
jgi:hypothetical protein